MSGTRNPLLGDWYQPPPDQTANPLYAGTPTWADAAQWHAQNLRDTATAMQNPQTWTEAARQYGNALLMGSIAPSVSIHPSGSILSNGVRVGRVKYEHGDQSTRIADIEIFPSYQNQGVGSAAIQQIQEEAAARGNPVVLSTDAFRGAEAQANQRRLYERLGFVPNRGPDAVAERIGKRRVAEELVWRKPDAE